MRSSSIARSLLLWIALSFATPATAPARATAPLPVDRAAADVLAASAPGAVRDAQLAAWSKRASLDDLLYVLRRGPAELASAEGALTQAALARTPEAHRELRRRLEARALLLDAKARAKQGRDIADLEALRPRQSVLRIAALLPDRGDYAGYSQAVRRGATLGLSWGRAANALPLTLEAYGTGDAEPARIAAALDTAARTCGAVIGEMLSAPTYALATGTTLLGIPLISPTATDEAIGAVSTSVFAIGPSAALRAQTLARTVLSGKPRRVALLVSSADDHATFTAAFAAAAESLGATIVKRSTYGAGTTDFKIASHELRIAAPELLFWSGEPREAEALLQQLATDHLAMQLCGPSALAPDQYHATIRKLLEGVRWVGDDWLLPADAQAALDSLAHDDGEKPGPLDTRGFIAGHHLAMAIDSGARTPTELTARLHAHVRTENGTSRSFFDALADSAHVPVYVIQKGRAVEVLR